MKKSSAVILALGLFVLGLILGSYGSRFVSLPFEGMFSQARLGGPTACGETDWDCRSCEASGGVWNEKRRVCSMTVKSPVPARTDSIEK